jgi:hypothetical protein
MPRIPGPILVAAVAIGGLVAAAPAGAVVNFTFDAAGGGIGGSGFTETQSGAGGQDATKVNVAGGRLNVTSTPGIGVGQVNALAIGPGIAAGTSYYVETQMAIPALTTPFQEAGIWAGKDVNNNVKLTLQYGAGGPQIELLRPGDVARHKTVNLTGVTAIRLTLQVNTLAGVAVGKYNLINGMTVGNTQTADYVLLPGMGTATDRVGVQTSNVGVGPAITANYDDFSTGTIGIDTVAPTVGALSPTPNQGGVATTGPVTVSFSEQMDPRTVSGNTFTLSGPGGPVPAAVTGASATSFVLTPSNALAPGTTYTASLSGEVRDQYGNPLAPTSWSFTTAGGAAPGGGPPPPAGGSTGTVAGTAPPASLATTPPRARLKLSLSATRSVKVGKKAKLTLRFDRAPATTLTVSRKPVKGKKFTTLMRRRASARLTVLQVPVGTKPGKVTFRVAYKDGAASRTTQFTVTVTR